jgi:L-alanine-DL-glutamate epimerase-like enolase superfamily enzyme
LPPSPPFRAVLPMSDRRSRATARRAETLASSRRAFLKRFSLGALGAALGIPQLAWRDFRPVRISRIDVFPILYPMVGRFKFFEGPEGSPTGRSAAVVKITAEDGTVGWGESLPIPKWSYETRESVTSTIRNYLAPELIGKNALDIAGAHFTMNHSIAPSFSTGAPMAKAGVDIALHDLVGKLMNQPLAGLWGRPEGGSITLSWTCNPVKLEDLDALIDDGLKRGYRNFNVKVSPDPKFDIELCRRVKQRVPDGFLWADANGGYDLPTALEVAPKLADVGVDVLEQPIPANRLSGYRELKRLGALPILMDEGVVSPVDLIEYIRLDLLDGVVMKPARSAGLLPSKEQWEIAQDAGLLILGSGLTDPDMSLAATLALFGAFQYTRPAALNGPQYVNATVLKTPLTPRPDGTLAVPTGPGLGIEVDEAKLRALAAEE